MQANLTFLTKRGDAYYFRRRIPARHHNRAQCSEWKLALGKTDAARSQILINLQLLTEATDAALAALDRGERVSPTLLLDAVSTSHPKAAPRAPVVLSEAGRLHAKELGQPKLGKAEEMGVRQFCEFAGNIDLRDIDRELVRNWITWLRDTRGQGEATVRRRLGSLSAIYSSASEHFDPAHPNPFSRHRLRNAMGGYRLPFSTSHLVVLAGWLGGPAGDRATGLIIRLLRATGARPLEIGGLNSDELRLCAPVPFVSITPNSHRRLKTPSSQRLIPLVGDGLLAAQAAANRSVNGVLFPATCHETGSLSARLNKALRSAGVPKSEKLTAYSFRHTLEEALRVTDAPFDVQQAILGHAKRTSTERYGARHVSLARMRSALETAVQSLGVDDAGHLDPLKSQDSEKPPNAPDLRDLKA